MLALNLSILFIINGIYLASSKKVLSSRSVFNVNEDVHLNTTELIRKYGYPCEVHYVTTEDNYILALHRIPQKKNITSHKKTPVILVHGILGSSADFLFMGPRNSLAYVLADEGYDVWMLNCRGNVYSRNHTELNPNVDSKFWKFSWHEIGIYDLPATIDYILKETSKTQVFHVGHSQGATSLYVMCSERPEYNSKIRSHFSYAPVSYMANVFSPLLRIIAPFINVFGFVTNLIGMDEFLPSNSFMQKYIPIVCGIKPIAKLLCSNVYFLMFGFNEKELNTTLLPVFLGHMPAGASTRQLIHYVQEINSGRFCKYDYSMDNFKIYGSFTPPAYDISKIVAPMYLFYSKGDWLCSNIDVEEFAKKLPNLKKKILNTDDKWSHADYVFGIHAKQRIYDETIVYMKNLD